MERFIGLAGILAFMAIAYLLSHQRSAIHWQTIAWGLGLQWIFALVVLKGTAISGLLSFLALSEGRGLGDSRADVHAHAAKTVCIL